MISIFVKVISLILMLSSIHTKVQGESYPPYCYEELASSYDQLAASYEQLAYQSRSCCGVFSICCDYLYWQPSSDSLDYAIDGIGTSAQGTLYDVEPGWSSAYRVSAAYDFPCHSWRLAFQWTDFKSTSTDSVSPSPGLILYATKSNPTSLSLFTAITRGSATWDIQYRSLCGSISYLYRMRNGLSLIPCLGVRWDRIIDDLSILYTQAVAPTTAFLNFDQTLSGVGPVVGFGTEWCFFEALSLYGNFFWSPLWLNAKNFNTYNVVQASTANNINVKKSGVEIVHAARIDVGIKLDYRIKDRVGVTFALGWEANTWIDERHNIYFMDQDRDGTIAKDQSDLLITGLVAKVCMSF